MTDRRRGILGFLNCVRDAITAIATGESEPRVRDKRFQGTEVRNWVATFRVLAVYRQAVKHGSRSAAR